MRIEATRAVLGKPVVVELTCPTPRGSPDEKEVLYSPPALIVDAVMSIIGLPDRTVPTPWSQHQTVKNGGREGIDDCGLGWGGYLEKSLGSNALVDRSDPARSLRTLPRAGWGTRLTSTNELNWDLTLPIFRRAYSNRKNK